MKNRKVRSWKARLPSGSSHGKQNNQNIHIHYVTPAKKQHKTGAENKDGRKEGEETGFNYTYGTEGNWWSVTMRGGDSHRRKRERDGKGRPMR